MSTTKTVFGDGVPVAIIAAAARGEYATSQWWQPADIYVGTDGGVYAAYDPAGPGELDRSVASHLCDAAALLFRARKNEHPRIAPARIWEEDVSVANNLLDALAVPE